MNRGFFLRSTVFLSTSFPNPSTTDMTVTATGRVDCYVGQLRIAAGSAEGKCMGTSVVRATKGCTGGAVTITISLSLIWAQPF